ncbi:hypothetical protein BSKO_02709 [Bryopsis sp. KO-2023]|nr:hypothetical protein BSKO_02709 [Bryopsis sp. KO-2023]
MEDAPMVLDAEGDIFAGDRLSDSDSGCVGWSATIWLAQLDLGSNPDQAVALAKAIERWAETLGSLQLDELSWDVRRRIRRKISSSIKKMSFRSLVQKLVKFFQYCAAEALHPVVATSSVIYGYVDFLQEQGRVNPRTAPQYISAVSSLHQLVGLSGYSAHDAVTARLVRQWKLAVPSADHVDQVVALPADEVVAAAEEWVIGGPSSRLRDLLLVVVNFLFFNRGDTAVHTRMGDFWWNDNGTVLWFRERAFKGKLALQHERRVRQYPCKWSVLNILFSEYTRHLEGEWESVVPPTFWSLPLDPQGEKGSRGYELRVRRWIASRPNLNSSFSPHSVRRGGASAAFAVGVDLLRIRLWVSLKPMIEMKTKEQN